jgi:phosphoribosylformylglycinamidine (FGAM) synthase-like enzyme
MQIMNNLGQKHFLVVDIDSESESTSALRDTSPATGDYYVLLVTKVENGFIVFDLVKIPINANTDTDTDTDTETTNDTLTSSLTRSVIEAQRQKATKARIEKDLKRIKGKKSKENSNKRKSKNGRA